MNGQGKFGSAVNPSKSYVVNEVGIPELKFSEKICADKNEVTSIKLISKIFLDIYSL